MFKTVMPGLLVAGACFVTASAAAAKDITFVYSGTVTSFTDVDNVYGFGAGAVLNGASVTDTYVVDTTSPSSMFASGTFSPGGVDESWTANLPAGASSATSTINGHTISLSLNVVEYSQQVTAPPGPYDQTILDSQAIGYETSGTAVGSEFLIRDEAVSYSLRIPLSLTKSYTITAASLAKGHKGAASLFAGVFFPYSADGTAGNFNITSVTVNGGVPEPASWAMMLLGMGVLGGALRVSRRQAAATPVVS